MLKKGSLQNPLRRPAANAAKVKMYEQCFSIELKPWRKPSGKCKAPSMCRTGAKKRREAGGNPPARAAKRPEKMNEMYEQCFPMELKNHRENLSPFLLPPPEQSKKLFSANGKELQIETLKPQNACASKRTFVLDSFNPLPHPSQVLTVTVDWAVLLAPGHRSFASSQGCAPVTNCKFAR